MTGFECAACRCEPVGDEDLVKWSLERKKVFTARSLYRFMLNPGTRDLRMLDMWKTNSPLKRTKKILWMYFRRQTQSASQLALRGLPGDILCVCYGVDRWRMLIVSFSFAPEQNLCVVREVFGKQRLPSNRDGFVGIFLNSGGNRHKHIFWYFAAAKFDLGYFVLFRTPISMIVDSF
jgi:hypothetical protein